MPRALKSEGADGASLASAELAAADGCCSAPFMREGDVPGVPKPSERSSQGAPSIAGATMRRSWLDEQQRGVLSGRTQSVLPLTSRHVSHAARWHPSGVGPTMPCAMLGA